MGWLKRVFCYPCLVLILLLPPFAKSSPVYSNEDYMLLWDEANKIANGSKYTYQLRVFTTRTEAEQCDTQCFLSKPAPKNATARYNEMSGVLRKEVENLEIGEISLPFVYQEGTLLLYPKTILPPNQPWAVLKLNEILEDDFPEDLDSKEWVDKYARVSLPSLDTLRNDPAYSLRSALFRLYSADDLNHALVSGVIKKEHLNTLMLGGNTLLSRAIFLKDIPFVTAVLDAGADVNFCVRLGCPLEIALALDHPNIASLLLERKADPDLVNKTPKGLSPLAVAAGTANIDSVRLLLKYKANPNNPASAKTPLMMASVNSNREIAELLLASGESPLESRTETYGAISLYHSLLFYAPSEDTSYLNWLRQVISQSLEKTKKYEWSATIEQAGIKYNIRNNSIITLRHKPFNFVIRMNSKESQWRVIASEDKQLPILSRDFDTMRSLLGFGKVVAESVDTSYLSVSSFESDRDTFIDNMTSHIWQEYDSSGEVVKNLKEQAEYSHKVTELFLGNKEVSISKYTGDGIYVVMGVTPNIGIGADIYKPLYFQLKFAN